jgi:SAM-dependent methyltransferase
MSKEIIVDWNEVLQCNKTLNNEIENKYFEYTWHKYYDNPGLSYSNWPGGSHEFDDHWLIKYYLNFVFCGNVFKDSTVLDLGCGICFYAKWAIDCGARLYHGVEPDSTRWQYSQDLCDLRNISDKTLFSCVDAESYLGATNQNYDVVMLSESLCYMHNQHKILSQIKSKVNPKYLIVESVVAHDVEQHPDGLFSVSMSPVDTKSYEGYKSNFTALKIQASRKAYEKLFESTGWKIKHFYDFSNYQGRHFPTQSIKEYRKMFYVLTQH